MNEWKPIETAPQDGTRVLTCVEGKPDSVRILCFDRRLYDKKPRPLWQGYDAYSIEWYRKNQPTHWQKLPAAATVSATVATTERN